jgi:signal transduction histidine kinase
LTGLQAEGTSNFSHEGSGLGLAISKAYVEILGGKIWVKVKKEMAARFILHYPIYIVTPLKKRVYRKSSHH